jgi:hypothetical protein
MSLIAILYHLVPEAPLLVAANRDEPTDFIAVPPTIQSGKPRILACVDDAGGTMLGVNQNGLFVGAVRRRRHLTPVEPKSRAVLCRELLRQRSAHQAVDMAFSQLETGQYGGVNFIIADAQSGCVVHGGNEISVVELSEGLHILSARDVDDMRDERVQLAQRLLTLQILDSPVKFLAVASKVFARAPSASGRPGMVIRDGQLSTVSSTLIALGKKPRDAIFQFAAGPPDRTHYEDFSPMLRDILSRGLRESRLKAGA